MLGEKTLCGIVDIIELVRLRSGKADISYELIRNDLVLGERAKLISAIYYLTICAEEAGAGKVEIRVSNSPNKRCFVVEMRDDGKRIEAGMLANSQKLPGRQVIFEEGKTRASDHGMGLYGCFEVVREYGGFIEAYNGTDEKGARFIISLPIHKG